MMMRMTSMSTMATDAPACRSRLPTSSFSLSCQRRGPQVICDDTDNIINHVVYHYFQAADRGLPDDIPPEFTKEEQLMVAILISQEEERRAFPGYEDALALSVAPPPPSGLPPMQPPHTPLARPRRCRSWAGLPGHRLHRRQW
jgi:hypothetical protein